MTEVTHNQDVMYDRAVATVYRRMFRQYKKLNDLPRIERLGWIAGFAIGEDEQANEDRQAQVRTSIQRQDWQTLTQIRSCDSTQDNLSYYVVQCDGRTQCIVEIDDPSDGFVYPMKILWHHQCDTDQTDQLLPLVDDWQYLINPDPNPSLIARFLDFINWY